MLSDILIRTLANARSVAVLTGAGISAESGVPTFRDPDGLWKQFKPMELANMDAFLRNPDLVWEWYSMRRTVLDSVQPNAGHYALAEMEAFFPDFTLITQNVDGLHQQAGSRKVHELHGSIRRSFCLRCRKMYDEVDAPPSKRMPSCACGGAIRPDVVWFGEMLPEDQVDIAWRAAERAELFFAIGTSGEVYPAAQLPSIARQHGAYVVEINPHPTAISGIMNECLLGASGVILPVIVDEVRRWKGTA